MASKRLLLSLNAEIYKELEKKAEENLMTMQELISDILRRSVLASKPRKKSRRGRPKKVKEPFIEHFSRKR